MHVICSTVCEQLYLQAEFTHSDISVYGYLPASVIYCSIQFFFGMCQCYSTAKSIHPSILFHLVTIVCFSLEDPEKLPDV